MKFWIRLEQDEDGFWVAECVEVPGANSQGRTVDEALENVRDAIQGVFEVRRLEARRRTPVETSTGEGQGPRIVELEA